jgi:hypothetical protein
VYIAQARASLRGMEYADNAHFVLAAKMPKEHQIGIRIDHEHS